MLRTLAGTLLVVLALAGLPAEDARARPPRPARNSRPVTTASQAATTAPATPPEGPSTAAVLMDARTGQIVYAREPHLPWPPASTTKILTALVALERLPVDATVRITHRAARHRQGAAIRLEEGERYPFRSLLYAMMLLSANDAAVAVAEAAAGSVETFVAQMNARARALGARHSHFVVPDGLHHPEHYSTAYDLALLARAAMNNPEFARIAGTKTWTWDYPPEPRVLVNRNRLLWQLPGADGVKTGWISQSGRNVVASATRDGWRLIAVVLNSPIMFTESMQLLNYGFARFASVRLAARGEVLARARVDGQELRAVVPADVYAALPRGEMAVPAIALRARFVPPIPKDSPVGQVIFLREGTEVARAQLVAAETIHPPRSVAGLWRRVRNWILWWR